MFFLFLFMVVDVSTYFRLQKFCCSFSFYFHKCSIIFLVFTLMVIISVTLLTYSFFLPFVVFLHLIHIDSSVIIFICTHITSSLRSSYFVHLHQACVFFPWPAFSLPSSALCNPKAQAKSLALKTTQCLVLTDGTTHCQVSELRLKPLAIEIVQCTISIGLCPT